MISINGQFDLDSDGFRRRLRDHVVRRLHARSTTIGDLVVQQTRRRFDDKGDDELRWPDLWASNAAAVRAVATRSRTRETREKAEKAVKTAERTLAKAEERGDIRAIRAAKTRLRNAESKKGGSSHYRAGGEPLRDTGVLKASITRRITATADGFVIEWGPSVPYGKWHQTGFTVPDGKKLYIPLTRKGARKPKGSDPKAHGLVSGVDYVILQGVTVPARPFVRMTNSDRIAITRALARKDG